MKTLSYFFSLALLPLFGMGQALVHDAPNYQAAMMQIQKTEGVIYELEQQINWLRLQSQLQLETLIHQDSIADEQLNTERLLSLQMAEHSDLFEQIQNLSVPLSGYSSGDNSLDEFFPGLSGQDVMNVNELYHFFYPNEMILDAEEGNGLRKNQLERRKAAMKLVKKQHLHIALVYLKLAGSEATKAAELREYLLHSDVLSMSEGERVNALLKVDEVLARSINLRKEAFLLIQEAVAPDPFEQLELEMESARHRLHETRKQFEELIPGYGKKEGDG